jgi:hypothetical protein
VVDRKGKPLISVRDVPNYFRDMAGKESKDQASDNDASDSYLLKAKMPIRALPRRPAPSRPPLPMASFHQPRKHTHSIGVEEEEKDTGESTLLLTSNYENLSLLAGQIHIQKKTCHGYPHQQPPILHASGSSLHQLTAQRVVGPRRILLDGGYDFDGYQYETEQDGCKIFPHTHVLSNSILTLFNTDEDFF